MPERYLATHQQIEWEGSFGAMRATIGPDRLIGSVATLEEAQALCATDQPWIQTTPTTWFSAGYMVTDLEGVSDA